jgi:hypothetical protein
LGGPQYCGAIQEARRSKRRIARAPKIALVSSPEIHLPTGPNSCRPVLVGPFDGFKCSAIAVPITAIIVSATTKVAISFMAPILLPTAAAGDVALVRIAHS